jgi:RNA polymerase sigma-B factor
VTTVEQLAVQVRQWRLIVNTSQAASSPELADRTRQLLRERVTATDARRRRIDREVVILNMPMAESVARRFRRRGLPFEDLVQVAFLGLTKAVKGYDPAQGDDFLRYAVPTVSGEIKRHFRDAGWVIRPPRRIQELRAAISTVSEQLAQELGRSPRMSEIAHRVGVPVDEVAEALVCDGCYSPSSLDERGSEDDGVPRGDLIGSADADLDRVELLRTLGPLCRRLGARDRRILYLRFFKGWTQREIAAELDVTQMQVSRLLSSILGTLRAGLADQESATGPTSARVSAA